MVQGRATDACRECSSRWLEECCDHGDWYRTKFLPGSYGEEWFHEAEGRWKRFPPDIIHYAMDPAMPPELRRQDVLFVYNGTETCFWPPEHNL
jgi:hypothetical protein